MVARSPLDLRVPGSNPIAGNNFFFLHKLLISYISTSRVLTITADPILKLAMSQDFPQLLKKAKNFKKRMKKISSLRDLNPDLPIQSQLCLPLDQGFMKIA